MRAGALRQRVTIQEATDSRNDMGEVVKTWTTFAERWAAVEPVSGREFFENGATQAEITHTVRIRYTAGVEPTMRVLHGSRVLEIESVININERDREMHLMCVEVES